MANDETDKKRYEAPVIVPLGELAVSMGACADGTGAGGACATGPAADPTCRDGTGAGASCHNGPQPQAACLEGVLPTQPSCTKGSQAIV